MRMSAVQADKVIMAHQSWADINQRCVQIRFTDKFTPNSKAYQLNYLGHTNTKFLELRMKKSNH